LGVLPRLGGDRADKQAVAPRGLFRQAAYGLFPGIGCVIVIAHHASGAASPGEEQRVALIPGGCGREEARGRLVLLLLVGIESLLELGCGVECSQAGRRFCYLPRKAADCVGDQYSARSGPSEVRFPSN
jgi:hypothetical protein